MQKTQHQQYLSANCHNSPALSSRKSIHTTKRMESTRQLYDCCLRKHTRCNQHKGILTFCHDWRPINLKRTIHQQKCPSCFVNETREGTSNVGKQTFIEWQSLSAKYWNLFSTIPTANIKVDNNTRLTNVVNVILMTVLVGSTSVSSNDYINDGYQAGANVEPNVNYVFV